jgi:hypothetical protein
LHPPIPPGEQRPQCGHHRPEDRLLCLVGWCRRLWAGRWHWPSRRSTAGESWQVAKRRCQLSAASPAGAVARTLDGRLQHLEDGQLQHEVRLPGSQPGGGPLLLLPGGRTLLAGTAAGSVVALPWPGAFPAAPDYAAGSGRLREQRLHGTALTHMLLCPGTNVVATARWVRRPPPASGMIGGCAGSGMGGKSSPHPPEMLSLSGGPSVCRPRHAYMLQTWSLMRLLAAGLLAPLFKLHTAQCRPSPNL